MTNEDRNTLQTLRQQHADLRQMLERLTSQLVALEARTGFHAAELFLPPVPPEAFLPPVPPEPADLPPLPLHDPIAELPPVPMLPPVPAAAAHDSHLGRWVLRIGIALVVLFLVLLAGALNATLHISQHVGLLGRFGLLGLGSAVVLFSGSLLERGEKHSFFSRLLLVTGVAGLYAAFLEAHALATTGKVDHELGGGAFLLVCTCYVLFLAFRYKSQLIGVIGAALGYVSMALVPAAWFSLGADFFLTALAAAFLLWRGWTTMATVAAAGAYLVILHRLAFDTYGDLVLDTSRALPFLPPAVYLVITWLIFTTAIILCTVPTFRGGRRLFFASFNNGAGALLLAFTAYISGYGLSLVGWALFDTAIVFLVVSRFAGFAEHDPVELMGAYAAQGLALFTAGLLLLFTGFARAFLLLLETLLLGIAGAFAGDRVLITATYAAGFFATIFAIWQIAVFAHHPWLLGFGGAVIMLINAWSSRGDIRHSRAARSSTVLSTTCYCLLALGLIFAALSSELSDATLPVALALGALFLTFLIYHFSIHELPSLAQILMLAALVLVLFPVETGEELPGWSIGLVALATLILLTWWARQRVALPGAWLGPVSYLYALGLVYLAVLTVQPYLGAEGWMVAESMIAVVFLAYGALTRVWPLAVSGQVLLVLSLCHMFVPPQSEIYPWSALAAAIPIAVTFLSGRAALSWLALHPEIPEDTRDIVRFLAFLYKAVALCGLIRWIFGIVPPDQQLPVFFLLGTLLSAIGIWQRDGFGVRASFLLGAMGLYLCVVPDARVATGLTAFALLLFLLQMPPVNSSSVSPVTRWEGWLLTIAAAFTAWYFVSVWAWTHGHVHHPHIALAWTVCVLFLAILSRFFGQPRLLWCASFIFGLTILRLLCYEFWVLPTSARLVTLWWLFVAALVIGLGYLFPKDSEKPPRIL